VSAEFVPLADIVRPPARMSVVPPAPPPADREEQRQARDVSASPHEAGSHEAGSHEAGSHEVLDVLREARLFRARVADALDAAVPRLLRDLAAAVLARELRLAPCDVDALVRDAVATVPVVRVRVAPGASIALDGVAVVRDDALGTDDAIVELAGGEVDARLGVRLACVLEAFA